MKRIAFLAMITAFASCTYMTTGIFYTVEKEELIPDAGDSLANTVSVSGIARQGTTTYVAARSLFSKADGASEWSRLVPSEWGDRKFVLDAASGTGRIFVIAANTDASSTGVFQFNGTAWTALTGLASGTPAALTEIYDGSGNLNGVYLSLLQTDNSYAVQSINLGTGALSAVNLNGQTTSKSVQSAATDGATYYVSFGDARLFSGTLTNLNQIVHSFGGDIGGISSRAANFPVAGTDVFVSLSSGKISWSTDNGGTWTASAAHSRNSGEPAVVLGPITQIGTTLVAGSTVSGIYGGGYYEIVSDGGTGAKLQNPTTLTASEDNYNSTELRTATVNVFFNTGSNLFAGTLGNGLFKQETDLKWSWE